MRITGGKYRGRKLRAPEGTDTRPTSDRVREALFNILEHRDWGETIGNPLRKKHVLDGFAGTGALGLEALSRGAAHTLLIEKDRKALNVLRQNIDLLKCAEETTILGLDITRLRTDTPACSLIFLDPPYRKNLITPALEVLEANNLIADDALFVIETAKKEDPNVPEKYKLLLSRTYGDTAIHFYGKQ